MDEFKYVKRWLEEVGSRPGVQRGMNLGSDLMAGNDNIGAEEAQRLARVLHNQRALPPPG